MVFDVWLPDFKRAVSLVGGVAKTKLSNPVVENIVLETQGDRLTVEGSDAGYFIPSIIGANNVLHIVMPMTSRDDDQSDDDTTGGEAEEIEEDEES